MTLREPPWEPVRRVVEHDSERYAMQTRLDRLVSLLFVLFGMVVCVLAVQMIL